MCSYITYNNGHLEINSAGKPCKPWKKKFSILFQLWDAVAIILLYSHTSQSFFKGCPGGLAVGSGERNYFPGTSGQSSL